MHVAEAAFDAQVPVGDVVVRRTRDLEDLVVLDVQRQVAADPAVRAHRVGLGLGGLVPRPGLAHVVLGARHECTGRAHRDAVAAIDTGRVGERDVELGADSRIETATGDPLFPGSAIRRFGAARIGFIGVGAFVAETPDRPFTLGEIYRQLTQGDPRLRFPALIEARKIVDSGVAGPLMIVRGRYGHGGRPKDRDWRAIAEVSGGGEAIDQGMHLIDLARWFLGDFSSVQGAVPTCFWNMKVEDNAFFLLKTDRGQYAQLHASWTEWKNMFGLEIYGRVGKIDISGLGGSYGEEKLTYYQMVEGQEKPDKRDVTFDKEDKSWYVEFEEFMRDINEGRDPNPGLRDAQAALRIVETVYKEQGR